MLPHSTLQARLEAARRADEVLSPVAAEALDGGRWWQGDWPERLRAGLLEPRRGYRFRPENLALAHLVAGRAAARVVDLGAGSGSLLLIAAAFAEAQGAPCTALAIERQADVAERLERTLAAHALTAQVLCGDLREPSLSARALELLGGPAELVLANPPFFEAEWGRPSADEGTHASTHALHGDVGDFLQAARRLVADSGRVLVVFDAARLALLLDAASCAGFSLSSLLLLPDARPGKSQPYRVWVELRLGLGAALERLG